MRGVARECEVKEQRKRNFEKQFGSENFVRRVQTTKMYKLLLMLMLQTGLALRAATPPVSFISLSERRSFNSLKEDRKGEHEESLFMGEVRSSKTNKPNTSFILCHFLFRWDSIRGIFMDAR